MMHKTSSSVRRSRHNPAWTWINQRLALHEGTSQPRTLACTPGSMEKLRPRSPPPGPTNLRSRTIARYPGSYRRREHLRNGARPQDRLALPGEAFATHDQWRGTVKNDANVATINEADQRRRTRSI